jgi:hypothetical protein
MTHLTGPHPESSSLRRVLPLLSLLLLCGCSEPFIVLAGDRLEGEVKDPPTDWTDLNAVEVVQLETHPEEPYSVNIWMVGIGPDIYVATGPDETNWTVNIAENADVRLRVDGTVYELEATRVSDTRERLGVADAYVEKYGLNPEDNWVQDGQVFRLDRR